jgi:hypothetical protein
VARACALISTFLLLLAALTAALASASGGGWGSASYRVKAVLKVSGVYNGSTVDGRVLCRGVVEVSIINASKEYDFVKIKLVEKEPIKCGWSGSLGSLKPGVLVNSTRHDMLNVFIQGHYNMTSGVAIAHYYGGRPGDPFMAPEVLALVGYRFHGSTETVEPLQNYTTGALESVGFLVKRYMASYDRGTGLLKYYRCECLWGGVKTSGERLTYKLTITASTDARTKLVETLHYALTPLVEGLAGAVVALAVLAAVALKRCSCKSREGAGQPGPAAG